MKDYASDASTECVCDTTYELNHALVQLIQKTSGEQTHIIMNNIIAETNKMFKELEIDPNSKASGANWQQVWGPHTGKEWYSGYSPRRKNRLVTYPNTDIKFNLIVTLKWHNLFQENKYENGKWTQTKNIKNCNEVKVKVTLPNKILKYTTGDMSMLLAEGDILDESINLDELEIQQSKPPRKKKTKTDSKIRT
jgi:hypothetical protein